MREVKQLVRIKQNHTLKKLEAVWPCIDDVPDFAKFGIFAEYRPERRRHAKKEAKK